MSEIKYEAYCLKCKARTVVVDPVLGVMKTGMKSIKGTCTACGGKVYKILPKATVIA